MTHARTASKSQPVGATALGGAAGLLGAGTGDLPAKVPLKDPMASIVQAQVFVDGSIG